MPEPPELLTELLDHLVTAGLVRRDSQTTPSGIPRLILEPRDGVPAPTANDGGGVVLGAYLNGGIRARPREKFLMQDIVEIRIRAKTYLAARDIHRQLRGELIDRQAWMMGAREVLDCQEWIAFQRLGSDVDSFSHRWSLYFMTRASA